MESTRQNYHTLYKNQEGKNKEKKPGLLELNAEPLSTLPNDKKRKKKKKKVITL